MGRGAPHVPPIKIFENFHMKMTPPLIFSQPRVPPSKEFAKKNQGPPPPWISNYCASMNKTLFEHNSWPRLCSIIVLFDFCRLS